MTDTKKMTKHSTTETNINVEGSSEIILQCYKKGSQLKIRVISEGYDSELNVRFPRDLREEGALYSVETIEKTKGNYYLVKGCDSFEMKRA
jgi:Ca-activated chloride channel homolog